VTTLAITGATGFVGQAVLDHALAAGHSVRALARRLPPPPQIRMGRSLQWVEGTLETTAALDALCDGTDAVIHIAGAVNVPTRAAFAAANIAGTQAIRDAATRAGTPRFVHVSSLAAREPALSSYGWSKAGAEDAVRAASLDWTIIRPPGVYGPRDSDMLETFKMAKRGLMLLPPAGRGSWVHVDDLARLLVTAATMPDWPMRQIFEVEGDPPGGVSHIELARNIKRAALRSEARIMSAPAWAIRLAARGDRLIRGKNAKLTPDRAGYMLHPDWVARTDMAVPPSLWKPHILLDEGLQSTADWYRAHGWL
jgi:nucleoside-diphosphate-sugar epimerase